MPTVKSVSAHVEQRLCAKHLYGNQKKKYPELELKEVMWSAKTVTIIPAREMTIPRMKNLNEIAWKEIMDIPT